MWTLHNGFWDFALMFAFWVLIFAVAYTAFRALVEQPGTSAGATPAEQILDERYARGEISAEEYRERLETLRQKAVAA